MLKRRVYEWIMEDEGDKRCAVYGGVYHSIEKIEEGDMLELIIVIHHAIINNRFFHVETSDEKVFTTICHLCFIDPMLVRVYAQAIGANILW